MERMRKIGNYLFQVALVSVLFVMPARASLNAKAEIYPEEVGVGDQARIIVSVTSDKDFQAQDPDFPATEGIEILQTQNGGQSTSSRMSIVNGKTEFSKSTTQHYEYIVQFTKAGPITIPSITVNIDGTVTATAPMKLQVAQNSLADRPRRQNQPRGGFPEDDMFSQLLQQKQKILEDMQRQMGGQGGFDPFGGRAQEIPRLTLDVNTNESFFIYADVNKNTAYEGEQVTVNWYIYVKGNIEAIDRAKFPDLRGFWKEIIEEVPALQFSNAIVNDIPYRRALLASHALFPIKAGTAVVDEFRIKATVRNQTQFGWGQAHEFTKSSRRIPIEVKPLPQEGKPLSFSGAVGQFQIQTQVDGLQVKAGQPFTVKIRFEGQGNAKLIELPPIDWPESLTVFDTKSESKFFKTGQSYKQFEVLLIQSKEGSFKIPQINFSYFDPEQKKYVNKSTEEIQLTAIKSDQPLAGPLKSNPDGTFTTAAPEYSPQLVWPGDFSWLAWRNSFFVATAAVIFSFMFIGFLINYSKLTTQPSLLAKVNAKIKKIDSVVKSQDIKNVGSEAVNLVYLLLEGVHSNSGTVSKADPLEITQRISDMPLRYKEKYEQRLKEIFNYFQMIGFAPDQVRETLLKQKALEIELSDLKKISKEIADDLGRTT